jgi:hypothetical protein
MDSLANNLLIAAEACIEADPSPMIDRWTENLYNNLHNTKQKNVPFTTHVQHRKGNKREQKATK